MFVDVPDIKFKNRPLTELVLSIDPLPSPLPPRLWQGCWMPRPRRGGTSRADDVTVSDRAVLELREKPPL